MTATVRYPVADLGGVLVWATDLAEELSRPTGLTCVGCQATVRLRAGQQRRPHFAHAENAACSAGETALHKATIRVLHAAVEAASAAGRPYPVWCVCERCGTEREANLARAGGSVTPNRVLANGIRPDLLVATASGTALVVVEVIVTHAPDPAAVEVYDRLGLPLVRVWPTWEMLPQLRLGLGPELLRSAGRTVRCFDVEGACRSPRHRLHGMVPCPTCTKPARQLSVEVSRAKCYKRGCGHQFLVLDTVDCTGDDLVLIAASAEDLPDLADLAFQRGVKVAMHHSTTAGGTYLMTRCPRCSWFQGDNFIYSPDGARTDVSHPAWTVTLCASGHLVRGGTVSWPAATRVGRPHRVVGLVGTPAGLFRRATHDDGFGLTDVSRWSSTQIARRLIGLDS